QFEVLQKINEPLPTCPKCGGEVEKLINGTSFILKGDGWYVTDYGWKMSKEQKKEKSPQKSTSSTST
ncbi:MAG: zinc ribbon domain-containing protein, partial [Candidatus Desulfofervidaceae bacterium]|nr:zinc ribbon domain-containing protein [Candidatus Desulfofervidaceae bacterium]